MYDRYRSPDANYIPVYAARRRSTRDQKRPPEDFSGGLKNILSQFTALLPAGMDTEDLLLLGILLLLYLESKDEDFLILLAVMAFSMFRKT